MNPISIILYLMNSNTTVNFNYHVKEELGTGGMGTVYRVVWLHSDGVEKIEPLYQEVAVKFFNDKDQFENLSFKVDALSHLDPYRFNYHIPVFSHDAKNVLADGSVEKIKVMVLPYLVGLDLIDTVMQKKDCKIADVEEQRWFMENMCGLVSELHEKGIIHGDIKPDNFFYTNGRLCLIDFDFSAPINTSYVFSRGSHNFMAPETIYNCCLKAALYWLGESRNYTKEKNELIKQFFLPTNESLDVWSLLASLFSIFGGRLLFDPDEMESIMKNEIDLIYNIFAYFDFERVKINLEKRRDFFLKRFQVTVERKIDKAQEQLRISNNLRCFFIKNLKVTPSERPSIAKLLKDMDVYLPQPIESLDESFKRV